MPITHSVIQTLFKECQEVFSFKSGSLKLFKPVLAAAFLVGLIIRVLDDVIKTRLPQCSSTSLA